MIIGARGDMVYEGLVVGNDHHGLGVVHQKILQPLDVGKDVLCGGQGGGSCRAGVQPQCRQPRQHLGPVSYTHLDVYKRQGGGRRVHHGG